MFAYPLRTAALTICAAVGLAGCMGPYGYGGVSAGVGNGGYYDPYYGSGYGGYGYGAGYPGYGYGYGAGYPGYGYGFDPYWGWNDGFYYPGTGHYVYDGDRRRHRLTDAQRRYWELRRQRALSSGQQIVIRDNWNDFANRIDGGRRTQSGADSATSVVSNTERPVRAERRFTRRAETERGQVRTERRGETERSQARTERRAVRAERSSERAERRSEARSEGIGRSNGHRREESRED